MLADFHFLYPLWFLLLPVLVAFIWWMAKVKNNAAVWDEFIDEKLRPFILSGSTQKKSPAFLVSLGVAGLIGVVALTGPTWEKRSISAFQAQQGLVIGMDLSTSMIASDIKPSRLVRARFKLIDLLNQRKEGQSGLVVFAGSPFAVSPLTNDASNIIEQVKHLNPGTMPSQGSLLYLAIDESVKLLQQSNFKKGNILLISDGLSSQSKAISSAKKALKLGYKVSILGVGTSEGAKIPLAGGRYLQNKKGMPVLAKLDEAALKKVTMAGGGVYKATTVGDDDIKFFSEQFAIKNADTLSNKLEESNDREVEHWTNVGIWLSLLLVPFVLVLFRRGVLFSVAFAILLLPQTDTVYAFEWDALWKNNDQRGKIALDNQQLDKAQTLFSTPDWQAAAAYRKGDFKEAADLYSELTTADAYYNLGNALTKQGKLDEAIKAYDDALQKQPDLQDAIDNKKLVEELKKQQEQEKQKKEGQKNKDQKNSDDNQENKDNNQENNEQGEQNKKDSEKNKENEGSQKQEGDKASKDDKKEQSEKNGKADEEKKEQKQDETPSERGRQGKQSDEKQKQAKAKTKEEQQKEQENNQRADQFLRKIPDDAAGLWRRKFMYQYRQRDDSIGDQQPW